MMAQFLYFIVFFADPNHEVGFDLRIVIVQKAVVVIVIVIGRNILTILIETLTQYMYM